jgi:hypothetical protein
MKYKHLRSVAHNFGHSFVSRENHDHATGDYVIGQLARAAVSSGEPELFMDVLARTAGPPPLLTTVVRRSLARYAGWFGELLRSHGIAAEAITHATLRVRFDLSRVDVPGRIGPYMLPFRCVVEITDDRGRVHTGTVPGAWPVRLDNPPARFYPHGAGR